MRRAAARAGYIAATAGCFQLPLVLVVMAVQAQQLPVAAVRRVVVVIVVAVVDRKLAQVGAGGFAAAAAADPPIDLEGLFPVPLFTLPGGGTSLGQDAIELAGVVGLHSVTLRRAALICPRLTLLSTRRRCEPLVGRVGLRGRGAAAAPFTSSCSRASASTRLRS